MLNSLFLAFSFQVKDDENDTNVMFAKCTEVLERHHGVGLAQFLSTVHGPWAMVYFQVSQTLPCGGASISSQFFLDSYSSLASFSDVMVMSLVVVGCSHCFVYHCVSCFSSSKLLYCKNCKHCKNPLKNYSTDRH